MGKAWNRSYLECVNIGKGFICGTPVVSDGQTMGWNGMKYSLVSRDWIADCVEIMAEAYAVVSVQVNITE